MVSQNIPLGFLPETELCVTRSWNWQRTRVRARIAWVDEMVEAFGEKDSILIEVRWSSETAVTSAEATRGALRLWANGHQVWPGSDLDEAFEWTWVELAEFLARTWRWLLWENGFPFELPGGSITKLHVDLERRWSLLSMAVREEEEEDLYSFEERHDLARSLMGATAPPVWLVREGNMCWISTQDDAILAPFKVVERALRQFVDAVMSRLPDTEERASVVRSIWTARARTTADEFIVIATGLERSVLSRLQGDHDAANSNGP